jgi:N-acetylmuramoyl-L-alanine amidase
MRALLLLTLGLSLTAAPSAARAEELAVVSSGKALSPVDAYKAGSKLYLDAKAVGSVYGAQVYWYSVSGRVALSSRGRSLELLVGEDEAKAGGEKFALPEPVITRASRAFLPLSLLESEEFARWSGHDTRYDARTKTLVVERRGSVGAPRAFSYKGRTRVAVDLAEGQSWKAVPRGVGGLDIVFDGGAAESVEDGEPDDGVLDSYALKQEARLARLTLVFAEKRQKWRTLELSKPRRLAVDVFAAGVAPSEAEAAPASDSAPAAGAKGAGEQAAAPVPVAPAPAPAPARKRLIVVDAGHGGKDPGASGRRGTREKDVNLAVALELARVLKERGDFEVALTRDDDRFIPLSERSELANAKEADLFVSLHCNAHGRSSEKGFEVYSVSETASDPEAEKLAAAENAALAYEGKSVEDEMAKMILLAMTKTEMINESAAFAVIASKAISKRVDADDRGAKQAGFYVLRGTHAPAILVEMGFISHPKEEPMLASRKFRRAMAEGVAAGVADYARRKGWLE